MLPPSGAHTKARRGKWSVFIRPPRQPGACEIVHKRFIGKAEEGHGLFSDGHDGGNVVDDLELDKGVTVDVFPGILRFHPGDG